MLSRRTILVCLALALIALFKTQLKDGLEIVWYCGLSSRFWQGVWNGVPHYDPCAPADGPIPSSKPGDAPFSQGQKSYERAIHCPRGIRDQSRGIVLMVPCTSSNGAAVFSKTPFVTHLPEVGFDVCWVDSPSYGLGDMQLSGEFVAFAVSYLASLSSCGKIHVVSYSQGGSNAQWAITFWPSIRKQIINLVTIGAPHKGTIFVNHVCSFLNLIGGSMTSLLQMRQSSRYQGALFNRTIDDGGQEALVPTTSIYTFFDQLVLPQTSNSNGSSYLSGASNIAVQEACGKYRIVDHFGLILDMSTYGLVYDALIHGRPASLETFDRTYCEGHHKNLWKLAVGLPFFAQLMYRGFFGSTIDQLSRMKRVITFSKSPTEPLLMPYVCEKGHAPWSHCTPQGFCQPEHSRVSISKNQLTGSPAKSSNTTGTCISSSK